MPVEHYCTLFDSRFLPQGLALYRSLSRHAGCFTLWVLCMDEEVHTSLRRLALPNLRAIPLAELEDERLLGVKAGRSVAEYCWTLTPFLPDYVMRLEPTAGRVTYLDADLFFFAPPEEILRELDDSAKECLITEHDYSPLYDQSASHGIYCVQFVPFARSEGGRNVLRWWQDRCLEWCFDRLEPGRFGDQKYLDDWPRRFPREVHVLRDRAAARAPWNAGRYSAPGRIPVFYHFHGLRVFEGWRIQLYRGYRIDRGTLVRIYGPYLEELRHARDLMRAAGIEHRPSPDRSGVLERIKSPLMRILRFKRVERLR